MTERMLMTTGPDAAPGEWPAFQSIQRAALAALVAGDPYPFHGLWEHTPEVSLLGAFGGTALGWVSVRDRLSAVAAAYGDGVYQRLEHQVEQVHRGHALTVHLEAIRCTSATGEEVLRERRVSKVYRYGEAGWRIVHMHADPLLEVAFPGG